MDGEVAGNQSCTGFGESRGEKLMIDGFLAQTRLPVDRMLVKDSNVWRRPGRKYDSGIICESSHCRSPLTIKYLNNLYMIDREILVYERISKKLAYSNHSDVRDHNIVGPVLLSSGVCEGHNALLLLCFRRIGIPCIKVYGRTKTDGWHCWTIAWINGIPVHCDVTWDGTEEGLVRFDYLNLSDNQISGDHYDFKCARVPECTSETLSYYNYRGLCVHSFNDLKTRLKKDSQRGISPILIHFSYRPASGDCLKEAQRAFSEERISGNHRLYYHPTLKNLAVK